MDGRDLVGAVRRAAAKHNIRWGELVPHPFEVNAHAEAAEEEAYQEMAEAKLRLREHICQTYGITIRELSSLAVV